MNVNLPILKTPDLKPFLLAPLLLWLGTSSHIFAQESLAEAFFSQKVLPVLQDNCFKCHSHASGKSKGGLLLDSAAAILEGGETGPALVPGKPAESLLVKFIRSTDSQEQMPPKGDRLPEESIHILESWIQSGAAWPKTAQSTLIPNGPSKRTIGGITDEDRKWWAFSPIREAEVPPAAFPSTGTHPIDRFVEPAWPQKDSNPPPKPKNAP